MYQTGSFQSNRCQLPGCRSGWHSQTTSCILVGAAAGPEVPLNLDNYGQKFSLKLPKSPPRSYKWGIRSYSAAAYSCVLPVKLLIIKATHDLSVEYDRGWSSKVREQRVKKEQQGKRQVKAIWQESRENREVYMRMADRKTRGRQG